MKRLLTISTLLFASSAFGAHNLTGKWAIHSNVAGNESDQECKLVVTDGKITGVCKAQDKDNPVTGTVTGNKATWQYQSDFNGSPLTFIYTATLNDSGKIAGTVEVRPFAITGDFTAILNGHAGMRPVTEQPFKESAAVAAEPWQIGPFTRPAEGNPVVKPNPESTFMDPVLKTPVHWEALHTFNPAAIVKHGKVVLLYRAEDDSGKMGIGMHTSRLGMAVSSDGIHFTRRAAPVFYPADDDQKANEWPGGVEDPRLVETEDGTYVLTYTQWNRKIARLAVATSKDLIHWTKYGPAFQEALGGKYASRWSKSAGIVTRLDEKKGRLIAAKIEGKYWMYWGEGTVYLATSADLIHWTPVENGSGGLQVLLAPRPGRFDSSFPEGGPPPVLTKYGIVLIYNGRNAEKDGDPKLGPFAYSAGEALFDTHAPAKLLARTDEPVLKPELPYEKTGQYAAGTTFSEGLVYFKGQWMLYYGCADSLVSVAMAPHPTGP
ncbi:MAG TPA: glycoside hydrolase family 130 protein [Acidobacteriaceae bacterium]|nr:glycoside hydrolase family 130 protein [Acidobacteriaceae bacterium]